MKTVVFTDLDGTLLNFQDYSYQTVEPLVHQLRQGKIPVVFCSSKTKAEQQHYRKALHNADPFIVENGSAIFVPEGYFSFSVADKLSAQHQVVLESDFEVIVLGEKFSTVRAGIEQARQEIDVQLWGYADLSLAEIQEIIQLDKEFAQRAATRDFSETLLTGDKSGEGFRQFQDVLSSRGLSCVSGGKFHTVMGQGSDKGKAVQVLTELFKQEFGEVHTIGLGDSANDLPLLRAVDVGYLVQKPDKTWLATDDERIQKVTGVGPQGWVNVAQSLIAV
ncbi:HAD-IIB family hydrolase [Tunicatimonas pelagia]|uniref:HAD-IIB family hydrolase n=1 Tax=Tunicatimonas pelagia TaxID=931531 RepID=UPI002665695E|nr:HAD-IIB family hydrolase [Tunicatimonas pelagia]WKN43223.1 HAD-IIB family hydrolase [Tunicatimonas pelagia]